MVTVLTKAKVRSVLTLSMIAHELGKLDPKLCRECQKECLEHWRKLKENRVFEL